MKKLIIILGVVSCFFTASLAQKSGGNHDEAHKRIEASKVAYMTSYLDLSTSESTAFWPVYNEYQAALKTLKGKRGERKKAADMTEAEAKDKLNKYISYSADKAELTEKYLGKFRNIISDKKVLMLLKAEGDFKKQMVKRCADKKGERRGGGKGGKR